MKVLKKLQQNAAPTVGDDLVNKTYADGLVAGAGVVHLAGTETITGTKTITANDTIFDGGGAGAGASLRMRNALSNTDVFSTRSTGDSADTRLAIHSGGNILWGDGVNPADMRLRRNSSGVLELVVETAARVALQIADAPVAGSDLTNKTYVDGAVSAGPGNMVTTDTTQNISGQKTFTATSTFAKSLTLTDVNGVGLTFQQGGGNTDKLFTSPGTNTDTFDRFYIRRNGDLEWGGGAGAIDVTLVRSAAGILSLGANKLQSSAVPSTGNDLVNKTYADSLSSSPNFDLSPTAKHAVRVVSTTNIALSGLVTIDGQALNANDRVLVAGQTTGSQNGIYLAASGAWTRVTDADGAGELRTGSQVYVAEGSSNPKTVWVLTTTGDTITIGTTSQTWEKQVVTLTGAQTITGTKQFDSNINAQASVVVFGTASQILLQGQSSAANKIFLSMVSGDAQSRFKIATDGALDWGPGTAVTDVTLQRSAVGILSLGTSKLQSSATPSTGNDYINKTYGDATYAAIGGGGSSESLELTPVRVMTDPANGANVTIASPGASIDGQALTAGDRVLLGRQTTTSQNGVWIWNGAATPLTRPTDFAAGATVKPGTNVYVKQGTNNAGAWAVLTGNTDVVVDTTAQVWNSDGSWGFFRKNGSSSVRTDGQISFSAQMTIIGDQQLFSAGTPLIDLTGLSAAANIYLRSKLGADTTYKFQLKADGTMEWGAGGVAAIDTNLFRSAGDLKTNNTFRSALEVYARTGTAAQTGLGTMGPANEAGISLGSAFDTTLYRASAGVWRIKDTHKIQQNLAPSVGDDLTNKTYVDAKAGAQALQATFVASAQSGSTVPVRITLKDGSGVALTSQHVIEAWLADASNGRQSNSFVAPTNFYTAKDAIAGVTNGWPAPMEAGPSAKSLICNTDGTIDVGINNSASYDTYLSVRLADDTVATSSVIHVSGGNYSAAVLADNPFAYYRLDETAGTTVTDQITPGSQNGTYVGGPLLNVTPGAVGGSPGVNFRNGTNNATKNITLPAVAGLHFASGTSFSIEFWYKNESGAPTGYVIDWGLNDVAVNFGGAGGFFFVKDTGTGTSNSLAFLSSSVVPQDTTTWHHIVCTKGGSLATDNKIYIDGAEASYVGGGQFVQTIVPNTALAPMIANDQPNTAGATRRYNGLLDEIAFYNSVLSPARILAHYNAR